MIYNLSQINLASLVAAAAATAAVRRRRPAALRVGSAMGADRRGGRRACPRARPQTRTRCVVAVGAAAVAARRGNNSSSSSSTLNGHACVHIARPAAAVIDMCWKSYTCNFHRICKLNIHCINHNFVPRSPRLSCCI